VPSSTGASATTSTGSSSSVSGVDAAKLAQRAARFGIEPKTTAVGKEQPKVKIAGKEISEVEKEKLLKRAERFGAAISPVVKSLEKDKTIAEEKAKMLARQERFGTVPAADAVSLGSSGNKNSKNNKRKNGGDSKAPAVALDSEQLQKLAKRAERFGMTA